MRENKGWFFRIKVDTVRSSRSIFRSPSMFFTECFYSLEGWSLILDWALPRLMTKKAYDETFGSSFGFYNLVQLITGVFETLQDCGRFL
jgi:hypothetical protein